MLLKDSVKPPGEHVQFARHRGLKNQALRFVNKVRKRRRPAGEIGKRLVECIFRGRINKKAVYFVQEIVAGCSLNDPIRSRRFAGRHNLFRNDEKRLAGIFIDAGAGRMRRVYGALKIGKVSGGIVKTIGVVNPQAGNPALMDSLDDSRVDCCEDIRILDANCGEFVDVEEPAVIDFFGRDAPVAQPVCLGSEQFLEFIERSALPGRPLMSSMR
jgi:hypothetical protein